MVGERAVGPTLEIRDGIRGRTLGDKHNSTTTCSERDGGTSLNTIQRIQQGGGLVHLGTTKANLKTSGAVNGSCEEFWTGSCI